MADSIATYSMIGGYGPTELAELEQRGGGQAASEIAFEIASAFRGGSKKRKYRKSKSRKYRKSKSRKSKKSKSRKSKKSKSRKSKKSKSRKSKKSKKRSKKK